MSLLLSRRVLLAGSVLAAPCAGLAPVPLALAAPPTSPRAPIAAPPIAAPPIAIVMNSGAANIAIIDMTTKQVLRRAPTYREPSHWALTPDHRRLVVADASGNALFFFDPATGAALGHRRFADPYQLWFSPDGQFLVVNALRLNHVDVYRAADFSLIKRFKPGSMPSHLSYTPDSKIVFNSLQGSNALASFDLTRMTERWVMPVGKTPAGVMWHRGKVLVAIMGSNHVAVVDPATGHVTKRIVTDRGAHNLFLTPDRQHIYVTNRVAGSLSVIDADHLTVVNHIKMPGGPDDLCFAPDGKLWIALRFAAHVAVYDPVSGHIERIAVGRSPHGIFLSTLLTDQPALAAMTLA